MGVYKSPGVYTTHIRIPKNILRKIKIRRILGLPPEPIFISPGVPIIEKD